MSRFLTYPVVVGPPPVQGWVGCFPISSSSVGLYDYVLVIIYESGEPDIK